MILMNIRMVRSSENSGQSLILQSASNNVCFRGGINREMNIFTKYSNESLMPIRRNEYVH